MGFYVVIYDYNKVFAEQIAMVVQRLAAKKDIPLEVSVYTEANELLHDSCDWVEAPALFCLSLDSDKSGLKIARTMRQNGYSGEILFLAEGYDEIMNTLETSPVGCIQKAMLQSDRFRDAFLRCLAGVKTEDAHLIPCNLNGHIIGLPIGRFYSFHKEGDKIWGETLEGTSQVYLSWGKVEAEALYDDFFCVSSTCIIHMRTVSRVMGDRIVLRNMETYLTDDRMHAAAVEAFYRYLNREFPLRRKGSYERNSAEADK